MNYCFTFEINRILTKTSVCTCSNKFLQEFITNITLPKIEHKHLSKILWRKSSLTLKQKETEEFQKGVVRLTRIWSYSWDPCNTARAILQVPWVDTSTDVFKINRRDTIYVLIFHYILNSLHSNVYNTRLGTTKRK